MNEADEINSEMTNWEGEFSGIRPELAAPIFNICGRLTSAI
jgi:hypothetical protein